MNIDTLLEEANPGRALTMRERAELDRMVDATRPRRPPRAPFVVGIAAVSALLLAGGGAATAAVGIWHPPWYDAASDWTEQVKTVDRNFTVDGKQYHCTVAFTLESTYNGKGTPEFQKALIYMESLDPLSIRPRPADIDDLMNATFVGQGPAPVPPTKSWANEQVWLMDVGAQVYSHISAIGLDSDRIRISTESSDCNFKYLP